MRSSKIILANCDKVGQVWIMFKGKIKVLVHEGSGYVVMLGPCSPGHGSGFMLRHPRDAILQR